MPEVNNRTYMMVLSAAIGIVALLMFFSTPALAVEIQNGNMESVSSKATDYCAKFNAVGCQKDTINVYKPNIWNTWFGQWDFGQSWTDAHSGSWSTALWYQPPSECRWDENTSACGPVSQGREGGLLQHDVSFQISGASVSFWAKKCPFIPVQCKGWRGFWGCDGDQYYGTNESNTGKFALAISDVNVSNVSTVYPFDAGDTWAKYSVVPPINTSHVYDIYWQTLSLEIGQQAPNCILLDDFTVDYGEELVSPAEDYIADMETFTGFPYIIITGSGLSNVKVSKGFQNVPLSTFDVDYVVRNGYCSLGTVSLYDGDSSLSLSNFQIASYTSHSVGCGPYCYDLYCTNTYKIPLFNYTNLYSVNVSNLVTFSFDGDLGVRSTYTSPLNGYEDIFGDPDLYPVVIWKDIIAVNGSYQFHAYNFKPSETSSSNMKFDLLSSNGTVIDTSGGTYVFPAGDSTWIMDDFFSELSTSANINVSFKSNPALTYKSNSHTVFPLTGAGTSCLSFCDGTTYVDAHTQGSACVRNYIENATECTEPVAPPTPILNTTFDFEQPLFGDQGAFTPLTVPWVWFVIGALIAGIVALYFTNSFEISAIVIFTLLAAFTALGIMPLWLGIGVVVVIIAAIVYVVSKVIPIGGGGGGV